VSGSLEEEKIVPLVSEPDVYNTALKKILLLIG
jgi:hypothetical protein